jgi:hypothetical protein
MKDRIAPVEGAFLFMYTSKPQSWGCGSICWSLTGYGAETVSTTMSLSRAVSSAEEALRKNMFAAFAS